MSEGQMDNSSGYVSKSTAGNTELMTNIVEEKGFLKKLVRKIKAKRIEQAKKAKNTNVSLDSIPEEPANDDVFIVINQDKPPIDKKKLAVIIGIFIAIVLLAVGIILAVNHKNNTNSPNNEPVVQNNEDAVYIDETQVKSGRKDYSNYSISDLSVLADTYNELSKDERLSDEYINFGYALYKVSTEYASTYGYDDVGTILSITALARYYFANGRAGDATALLNKAISSTDNETALFHYYYEFQKYYSRIGDTDNVIKYDKIILGLPEEGLEPLMMDTFPHIKETIQNELNRLEEK